jgi:sodium transport system ATP-binding protein
MLRAEHLRKVFHTGRGKTVEAVKDASFQIPAGEVFGLLGPNGAGKTTLLRMLGTIITPTSGYCWVNGLRSDQATDRIRSEIGFLSGNTKLYGRLTATELLRYFGRLYRMPDARIETRTRELADLLKMHEIMDRRCDALSTGQTQKVSIARVMLHDPKVLILDEPTLGLDILTSRTIIEFILEAKNRGHSIVFSTHYMTEAQLLCDRIALIHQGSILALGTKEELYERTGVNSIQDVFLRLIEPMEAAPV